MERRLPKQPESYKLNISSPKESRRGGCEMEQYTGGKGAAQRFGFSCKFTGLLMSPLHVWRQSAANSCTWWARGVMKSLSQRGVSSQIWSSLILAQNFCSLFIYPYWSHSFKIMQKDLFLLEAVSLVVSSSLPSNGHPEKVEFRAKPQHW